MFGTAPVSLRDGLSPRMLYHFAAMYALGRPVPLDVRFTNGKPMNVHELSDLCAKHNVLDLYLWLGIRFPKYFVERDRCLEMKEYALSIIQETLHNAKLQHQYSHSDNYRRVRDTVESTLGGLPAALPDHIRMRMAKFLSAVDADQWVVFPNEARSGEQSAGRKSESSENNRRLGKKNGRSRNKSRDTDDNLQRRRSRKPWQSADERAAKKTDIQLSRIIGSGSSDQKKIVRSKDKKSFRVYATTTPSR